MAETFEPTVDQGLLLKEYSSTSTHELEDRLSVKSDLEHAVFFLKELLKVEGLEDDASKVVGVAFWNAALVSFFRCFGSGVRKFKFDVSIYDHLEGNPREFFEFLKNLRDKHNGHILKHFAGNGDKAHADIDAVKRYGAGPCVHKQPDVVTATR